MNGFFYNVQKKNKNINTYKMHSHYTNPSNRDI